MNKIEIKTCLKAKTTSSSKHHTIKIQKSRLGLDNFQFNINPYNCIAYLLKLIFSTLNIENKKKCNIFLWK